jgi:hypothetical protein
VCESPPASSSPTWPSSSPSPASGPSSRVSARYSANPIVITSLAPSQTRRTRRETYEVLCLAFLVVGQDELRDAFHCVLDRIFILVRPRPFAERAGHRVEIARAQYRFVPTLRALVSSLSSCNASEWCKKRRHGDTHSPVRGSLAGTTPAKSEETGLAGLRRLGKRHGWRTRHRGEREGGGIGPGSHILEAFDADPRSLTRRRVDSDWTRTTATSKGSTQYQAVKHGCWARGGTRAWMFSLGMSLAEMLRWP